MDLKSIIWNSAKLGVCMLLVSCYMIFSLAIPMGSMFAIAAVVDGYGGAYALLYIPWILLLPLLLKPLGPILEGDG